MPSKCEELHVKFGIQHSIFSYDGKGAEIVESLRRLGREAEHCNFDSFWVMDHFHSGSYVNLCQVHEPMLESWTTLGVMAGITSKIRNESAVIAVGTPEEVKRKIEQFGEAGVDYMIVNFGFEPQRELESLRLFGDEICKKM